MGHLSTPQLELQAAVMEVRLKEQIFKEHEMKINSCSFSSVNYIIAMDRELPS